jgi:hypothetical protein
MTPAEVDALSSATTSPSTTDDRRPTTDDRRPTTDDQLPPRYGVIKPHPAPNPPIDVYANVN